MTFATIFLFPASNIMIVMHINDKASIKIYYNLFLEVNIETGAIALIITHLDQYYTYFHILQILKSLLLFLPMSIIIMHIQVPGMTHDHLQYQCRQWAEAFSGLCQKAVLFWSVESLSCVR